MTDQPRTIAYTLGEILTPPILVVGVGNRLRGDDGAGPALVDELSRRGIQALDCGVAPENYLEKIVLARPQTVLFVDAADVGGAAGDMRLADAKEISGHTLSTHAASLGLACEYLNARIAVRIFLLGIQPLRLELDTGLSPAVETAVKSLAEMIVEVLDDA